MVTASLFCTIFLRIGYTSSYSLVTGCGVDLKTRWGPAEHGDDRDVTLKSSMTMLHYGGTSSL